MPMVDLDLGDIRVRGNMLVERVVHKFYEEEHWMDLELRGSDLTKRSDGNPAGSGAKPTGTFTLVFGKGGANVAGEVPKPITQSIGKEITIPGSGSLRSSEGFFDGWKDEETGKVYFGGKTAIFSKDTTLTVQWMIVAGG